MSGPDPDKFVDEMTNMENDDRQYLEVWKAGVRSAYLAGPMRGYADYNYPLFNAVAKRLRQYGYKIENPADTDAEVASRAQVAKHPLSVYMERDLADVARTDAVFVLPGWEQSEGARIEATVAFMLGHPVFSLPTFERVEPAYEQIPRPAPASLDTKPTNPKDLIGSGKLPLHLWPSSATVYGALALLDGALKYGRGNWREAGVRASIYVDALDRHMKCWFEGEEIDPDSGLPHLAHALACLAILVDAQMADKLVDDRQYAGEGFRGLVDHMTPEVERLKAKHAGRDPKHYTIQEGK